jgi:hypothetical protein
MKRENGGEIKVPKTFRRLLYEKCQTDNNCGYLKSWLEMRKWRRGRERDGYLNNNNRSQKKAE